MGGDGTIGGGRKCCNVHFRFNGQTTFRGHDPKVNETFNVKITFPKKSGVKPVTVEVGPSDTDQDEMIIVEWPVT